MQWVSQWLQMFGIYTYIAAETISNVIGILPATDAQDHQVIDIDPLTPLPPLCIPATTVQLSDLQESPLLDAALAHGIVITIKHARVACRTNSAQTYADAVEKHPFDSFEFIALSCGVVLASVSRNDFILYLKDIACVIPQQVLFYR